IVFFIGVYLLMKTYHLEGEVNKLVSNVTEQINEGKLSWVFSTFTVILLLVGFFDSLDDLTGSNYYDKHGSVGFDITFIIYILIILNSLVWWIILSLLVREAGKLFDTAILAKEDETYKEMDFWYYFNFPLFIISTGLFLAAGLTIVQYIADSSSLSFSFQNTMSMIIIGLALFIGGRYLYALGGEKEKKKRHFPYVKRRDKIVGWRH
ncbi:MAG: DUF373 family protein, partial [Thermoplasmata archaeon]|nr:DUF373 family protein [Thermoplasmata archaeon]